MTTAEAAEYLGLSPATLRSWRHRGIGPAFTPPTRRGFAATYTLEALNTWKEQHPNG